MATAGLHVAQPGGHGCSVPDGREDGDGDGSEDDDACGDGDDATAAARLDPAVPCLDLAPPRWIQPEDVPALGEAGGRWLQLEEVAGMARVADGGSGG
uniref:Uncharacterized protein n=1 Tax=Oryza glumipatula TaxID=40148 RepID=A0A0D9ZVD8_9ORYZ